MSRIQVLDRQVSELIAAGEVVERPGSVMKELLENAVDAGATAITAEIEAGGLAYLRVTDNGCGIPAEDVSTAFLRHATSKIRTAADLDGIGTLGFRGEALAAVAAVSRVSVLTRTRGAPSGSAFSAEGGRPGEAAPAGCPEGTTIIVRDLFFNTPARMKFMKRDSAEGAFVGSVVQQIALSRPEISFKLIREGKETLRTPGDGQLLSCCYGALGRETALGFLPACGSDGGMALEGFVSRPACCRGTRGDQFFFVNGRYIRSRHMAAALEEAYRNRKMAGKFPACVLRLSLPNSSVDVNVHPAKTEVKFADERGVFALVYHAVCAALDAEGETRSPAALPGEPAAGPTMTAPPTSAPTSAPTEEAGRTETAERPAAAGFPPRPEETSFFLPRGVPRVRSELEYAVTLGDSAGGAAPVLTAAAGEPISPPLLSGERETPPWRVAGELFQTYIIVEQGDRVLLIDKHAAHERMRFDRLRGEADAPMSQCLLTPIVFTPGGEGGDALRAHLPLLTQLGFEVEEFGGGSYVVRRVPSEIGEEQAVPALTEIGETLSAGGRVDPAAARDKLLRTIACRAAIRAGGKTAPAELEAVAAAVMDGRVKYCPHGRPVAFEMNRAFLERKLGRAP